MDILTNEGMLDAMMSELIITKMKYRAYSEQYQWKRFLWDN